MEGEIVQGAIGSVGKYDVAFKGGCLVLELDGPAGVSNVTKVPASAVLDALAAAIPGQLDDAVIGVIKAALSK